MEMDGEESNQMSMDSHNLFSINGQYMRMDTINEVVKLGDVELWRIRGNGMAHPFHMHGTSFQIISQNGQPPKEEDRGWKDVVLVDEGWTEVMMKFEHQATKAFPYMYHGHILEHEDAGMMGQFTVE